MTTERSPCHLRQKKQPSILEGHPVTVNTRQRSFSSTTFPVEFVSAAWRKEERSDENRKHVIVQFMAYFGAFTNSRETVARRNEGPTAPFLRSSAPDNSKLTRRTGQGTPDGGKQLESDASSPERSVRGAHLRAQERRDSLFRSRRDSGCSATSGPGEGHAGSRPYI